MCETPAVFPDFESLDYFTTSIQSLHFYDYFQFEAQTLNAMSTGSSSNSARKSGLLSDVSTCTHYEQWLSDPAGLVLNPRLRTSRNL
jgi:hypothetical protein